VVSKPDTGTSTKVVEAPETEADREKKRHKIARSIVPEGSNCLPVALKEDGAPRLELAGVGKDPILCAIDTDKSRLAGLIGCWKVDLLNMGPDSVPILYQDAAPLPGHNLDVMLDERCARGYCVPKEAKLGVAKLAHMSWSLDGSKVAVLVGDDVHLFDAASKAHESSFNVRGDKGLTNDGVAVHLLGDTVFVEGADQGPYSAVWVFKTDGTQVGPINALGGKDEKPLSTYHGSFSVLDPKHVAVADHGMETLTNYEIETGKRTKSVRKLPKFPCKADEVDAYWHDGDKVTDKCKDAIEKASGFFVGSTAVMGSKNLLVVLHGDRLGELAIIDPKSLAESKKALKMPWCDAAPGGDGEKKKPEKPEKADKGDKKSSKKADKDEEKETSRSPKPKKGGDPEEGGE